MKRLGFVSNSSSSSFVIGVGKIFDHPRLNKWIKDNDIELDWGIFIRSTSQLMEEGCSYPYRVDLKSNTLTVESFGWETVSIKFDPAIEETFFIAHTTGGAGDGDENFSIYDEEGNWEEYDYEVSPENFNNDVDTCLLNGMKEQGVKNFKVAYGAGRDG